MQQNPLVTIVCLCYNHQDFVVSSLQSVINQSYNNIELIIVDDSSTDNSKITIQKWLSDHPKVVFISNAENLGNTKSFNNAAKKAKGDFIIDLAADDLLLPDCVAIQVETFGKSKYSNLALVYGNCQEIDKNGLFTKNYFEINDQNKVITQRVTGDIYLSVLSGGDSICSVSAMMKKSFFDELNGYNENLAYEDLDFWIRCSRKFNIDFVDEIIVQKRILTNSLGANFFKKNSNINNSAYLILNNAISLNKTKAEDLALEKRINNRILHFLKNNDYQLFIKFILLKLKIQWRLNFRKYN